MPILRKGIVEMYQPIDQVKTGIKLKMLLKAAGYDVKYIQEYLHLSNDKLNSINYPLIKPG